MKRKKILAVAMAGFIGLSAVHVPNVVNVITYADEVSSDFVIEDTSTIIGSTSEFPPHDKSFYDIDGEEGIKLSDALAVLKCALGITKSENKYELSDALMCLKIALGITEMIDYEDWKKAYISYIKDDELSKFCLTEDLNNDGIKEIIRIGSSTGDGIAILTYFNNVIEEIDLYSGSIYYISDENKLYYSGGRNSGYDDIIFHLEGKDMVVDNSGNWHIYFEDEVKWEYELNGKIVSEEEYYDYFRYYTENESTVSIDEPAYSNEEMIAILSK